MLNFKRLTLLILLLINFSACSKLGVENTIGVYIFPEKLELIALGNTKSDIVDLIGQPVAKSSIDDNKWYYIYEKTKTFSLYKERILEANVLTLVFDKKGILISKDYKTLKDLNFLRYDKTRTKIIYEKIKMEPDLY